MTDNKVVEQGQSGGWQPIEMAPRDGTKIIVTDGKKVWLSYRVNSQWSVEYSWPMRPTHWMFMPEITK